MSNILKKTAKKTTLLFIIVAVVLAAAIAVGILCGVKSSVFNTNAQMKDSKTLTVSLNQYAYSTRLEEVENVCEDAFGKLDVQYELKGEMSGDESEIVYVFEKDVDLSKVQAALETKLNEKAEAWGADITVSSNSENAVSVLARHYTLRALIAGAVMAVLVFAYVSLRYKLSIGIVTAVATVLGMLLTASVAILTRIPVTSSIAYVIAVAGLFSAVTTLFTMNKLRANLKSENAAEQSAEELISDSIAVKEIGWFTVLAGGALVIGGALAASNVRWFAVLSLIGVLVAAFIGLLYAPAMYIPMKKAADKRPARNVTYKGAKKTSTKEKKQYVKAAPVEEAPAEEAVAEEAAVEEAPAEETVAEEAVAEEASAEEVVAEEASAEEVVAEEAAVEEAPVEEAVSEEAPVEETAE